MKGKNALSLVGVAGCLVLTAAWGILATPQTASAAKPIREKATYTITFFGDLGGVNGDAATGTDTMRIQDDAIGHMILEDGSGSHPIDLYEFFRTNLGEEAADLYFKSGEWTATGGSIHGIYPIKQNPENGVTVTIFFGGYNNDQSVFVHYRLDMEGFVTLGDGQVDIQTWANPGDVDDTITPSVIFTKWSVRPDTKGGGQKVLRLDDQSFNLATGIDVIGTRVQ